MDSNFVERHTQTPRARRIFEQEYFIIEVTDHILNRIEQAGMTQATIAKMLDTSPQNISQILNGSRNMTLKTLAGMAYACGLRPEVEFVRLPETASTPVFTVYQSVTKGPRRAKVRYESAMVPASYTPLVGTNAMVG